MRMPLPPAVSDTASGLPSASPAGNVLPSPPCPPPWTGEKEAEKRSRKMGLREAQVFIGGCVSRKLCAKMSTCILRGSRLARQTTAVAWDEKKKLLFCFHCLPVSREEYADLAKIVCEIGPSSGCAPSAPSGSPLVPGANIFAIDPHVSRCGSCTSDQGRATPLSTSTRLPTGDRIESCGVSSLQSTADTDVVGPSWARTSVCCAAKGERRS